MGCRVQLRQAGLLAICFVFASGVSLPASGESAGVAESAVPASLEALMARFAASGIVTARFVETRHISILEEPIETEGTLYFAPPDSLARFVTRPGKASVVVRGNRVAFRDEAGLQLIDLDASLVARHFVENLVVLLRGDLTTLQSQYHASFRSAGEGWVLDLEPRATLVRNVVERIRVKGRLGLREMETQETTGDRTVTVFHDVEDDVEMTPAEIERVFSLDGRLEAQ